MYIISQQIMYFWYQTGHLRVTPSLRFKTRLSLKLIFYSRAKKTYFHKKGLVLSLVLKQRLGVTQTTAKRSSFVAILENKTFQCLLVSFVSKATNFRLFHRTTGCKAICKYCDISSRSRETSLERYIAIIYVPDNQPRFVIMWWLNNR